MNVVPIVGVSSLLIIVRTIRQFSTDYFRVFQQEKTFSFFMTFQSLGVILAVYALIKTGHTLYHIVWAIIIIDLFLFICAQIIISGKIGVAKPDLKILAVFFNFCIPLFPASLLHWVTSLSDRYVIGFFRPVSDVASYSACCMLSMVIMFFYAPFYAILAPKLTQLWEVNNEATLKRVFYFSNKIPLLVSIPAVFGIGVLSPEILKLLTGSYLPGTFLLSAIICTGYIFFYVGCYYVQVFSLVKKTKYSTFGHLISAIINLLGNVILVPLIGILGAAIMTMLTFLFQMLYFMKVSRRYYDIALKWDFLWGSLSASFLMALVVWTMKTFLLRSVNTPSLIILIVSGVVCYLALLVLFSVIEPKEINSIKNIFVK